MEEKIDMMSDKIMVYVESVHLHHFVTRDSPHYALLKQHMANGGGSLSIKKEIASASSSHQAATNAQARSMRENPMSLEEEPMEVTA